MYYSLGLGCSKGDIIYLQQELLSIRIVVKHTDTDVKSLFLNYSIMKGFPVDHLNATVHEDKYCVPAWIKIKKDTR